MSSARQVLRIFQVDAFTGKLFAGNPAAVIPLEHWPAEATLQAIALENNLSETAFFVPNDAGYDLRWFTPEVEVDLCGHATLATAHVLFRHLDYQKDRITFHTRSGALQVVRSAKGYLMDFPADVITPYDALAALEHALGAPVQEAWQGRNDLMAVLGSREDVLRLKPDMNALIALGGRGIIATAAGGGEVDFVSRCFFPNAGVPEDPVTGSAHTTMTPYWAGRLGKTRLHALQLSARGGILACTLDGRRVLLEGEAVTYMVGDIFL